MRRNLENIIRFMASGILLIVFSAGSVFSQNADSASVLKKGYVKDSFYYKNEISFGLVYTYGFEKNVFNVSNDYGIGFAPGIMLGYCRYLNEKTGVGVRLFGNYKKIPDYVIYYGNGQSRLYSFEINTVNLDAEFRYFFKRGKLEPFVFLMLGISSGFYTSLTYDVDGIGFNGGAGTGLKFSIAGIPLSGEVFYTFGSSTFESKPMENSESLDFNASMIGFTLRLSHLWSEALRKKR
jgi:hypothetical protein